MLLTAMVYVSYKPTPCTGGDCVKLLIVKSAGGGGGGGGVTVVTTVAELLDSLRSAIAPYGSAVVLLVSVAPAFGACTLIVIVATASRANVPPEHVTSSLLCEQ